MNIDEGNQRRGDQQLVGDGIEQRTDGGHLPQPAGQVAIEKIRRRSGQEYAQGENFAREGDPRIPIHTGAVG
jgi:hypothetical protein